MIEPIYFSAHPADPEVFIAVKHGETGFHATTVYDQGHADVLNRRQGISEVEVAAAVTCSMFDCWDKFDQAVANEEMLAAERE